MRKRLFGSDSPGGTEADKQRNASLVQSPASTGRCDRRPGGNWRPPSARHCPRGIQRRRQIAPQQGTETQQKPAAGLLQCRKRPSLWPRMKPTPGGGLHATENS